MRAMCGNIKQRSLVANPTISQVGSKCEALTKTLLEIPLEHFSFKLGIEIGSLASKTSFHICYH